MMRAGGIILATALSLAACAFSSETPLFAEREAQHPFADGARYIWRDSDDETTQTIVFARTGAGYEVTAIGETGRPIRVMFVEMGDTPEDDYIAQVFMGDVENPVYAYMWRVHERYRVIVAPGAFKDDAPEQAMLNEICAARPNGECHFDDRVDVYLLYRNAVRPAFVRGSQTPEQYIDLTPAAEGATTKPEGK